MTLTTLDPQTALVVIDLQNGLLSAPRCIPLVKSWAGRPAQPGPGLSRSRPPRRVGQRPGRCTGADRGPAVPIRPGPDWADIIDELDAQPDDHRVTKQRWGAFHGTSLHAHLQGLGVTQVVVSGIATSAGVESTARSAHEHGYHVVVATDATTDLDAAAHQNSVERIFPKLGETATTAEVLEMLDKTR